MNKTITKININWRFYVRIVIIHILCRWEIHVVTSKNDHKEYSKSASDPECAKHFLFYLKSHHPILSWLARVAWSCLARILSPETCWAALVACTHCALNTLFLQLKYLSVLKQVKFSLFIRFKYFLFNNVITFYMI